MNDFTIVAIAFNRPNSLKRLLMSLQKVDWKKDSVRLYISIDKDNKNSIGYIETVKIANDFEWEYGEKIVDCKEENLGLKKHILQCGNLTNKYENLIVLEDDLIASPHMYSYAKQVVEFYKDNEDIAGFGLYSFQRNPINNLPFIPLNNGTDVYFMQYACSWGQIWTKSRWEKFMEWYEKNKNNKFEKEDIPYNVRNWGEKSWLKFHTIYTILNNKFFVYPHVGLTTNFSDTGTHNQEKSFAYQCTIYDKQEKIKFRFCNLKNANNVYDGYFENKKINELINYDKQIIADFYGEKKIINVDKKEYLLSTNIYNYKILKTYGLQMYPYEQNVINNIDGSEIKLYDLSQKEENRMFQKSYLVKRYLYKLDFMSKKDMYQIVKYFIDNICERLKRKLRSNKK